MDEYNKWLECGKLSTSEILDIKSMNEMEIEECFGSNLKFGTAGMRSLLGLGSSKMNRFTVQKATLGLALYLNSKYKEEIKVAIAYDSRHMSYEFSQLCAQVLATYGIKTYIYSDVKPTPMLSFLVREKKCQAGIMITASHNPKEYNGYKVYDNTGSQINLEESEKLIASIESIENIFEKEFILDYSSYISYVSDDFDEIYVNSFDDLVCTNKEKKEIKIVFTPVNGTSYKVMPKALQHFNFVNLICVEEQMKPDPEFKFSPNSNPEDYKCYELAIEYAKKNDADIIIANDPDADRLGVYYKGRNGEYLPLSGNQTGSLMINYLLNGIFINGNEIIYKSIVTGEMGADIAVSKGVEVVELLTGFKFVGEQIHNTEKLKLDKKFIFGYEESYGYLIKPVTRDKDAIQAAIFILHMAQEYLNEGVLLGEKLDELYNVHGYYEEVTYSINLSGKEGLNKISRVMKYYREDNIVEFNNITVTNVIDYNEQQGTLPKADVVKFLLKDIGWVVFRPSGTEPKLKIYISIKTSDLKTSKLLNKEIYDKIIDVIDKI